jgi:hypothetical protein
LQVIRAQPSRTKRTAKAGKVWDDAGKKCVEKQ